MESRNILIVHPKTNGEVIASKVFMAALKIKFEVANKDSYDPKFVNKIIHSKKQITQGNYGLKSNFSVMLWLPFSLIRYNPAWCK
jgi:hypothetical protein